MAVSGIRAGRENYARLNGTRGAATLLKSNVSVEHDDVALHFKAKGGKIIQKTLHAPRLTRAIKRLQRLPGKRLFQYRDDSGAVRNVRARQVNAFLGSLAGAPLSLKDFRTLNASSVAFDTLTKTPRATSERRRKKQVLETMQRVSAELGNTPAICRKSYVPAPLVTAFERGELHNGKHRGRGKRAMLSELLAEQHGYSPSPAIRSNAPALKKVPEPAPLDGVGFLTRKRRSRLWRISNE